MSRTVLVTGAGNGIGAATARAFAALGEDVVVTDIDADAAAEMATEITDSGAMATAHRLDVADPDSWQALSTELRSANRPPAVIVNNAFLQISGMAHELSEDDWNRPFGVTVASIYRSMHTFHDTLTAARGSMVNVSSVHAVVAWPSQPAYAAAKGAIVALSRQLSVDYAPAVRVNSVLPGSIETRVWDSVDEAGHQAALQQATLRRMGRPDEVAAAIVFLASDAASYVTGTSLVVDGGQTSTVAR